MLFKTNLLSIGNAGLSWKSDRLWKFICWINQGIKWKLTFSECYSSESIKIGRRGEFGQIFDRWRTNGTSRTQRDVVHPFYLTHTMAHPRVHPPPPSMDPSFCHSPSDIRKLNPHPSLCRQKGGGFPRKDEDGKLEKNTAERRKKIRGEKGWEEKRYIENNKGRRSVRADVEQRVLGEEENCISCLTGP